ncbi:MAG: flagellar assembly protein FliH [Burkholderiales bacterium]|nr:flagellar assembly protein FliH [Burkholderiales bacterium]
MSTSKPGQPPGGGQGGSGNPYARFIPKEELGSVQAWNPQTFAAPGNRAAEGEGGIRKPTLAERAAAEVKPFGRPGAAGATAPTGAKPEAARPAAPPTAQAKPAPKRPVVGGVPGEEPITEPQPEVAPPSAPNVDELVQEARQSGYQDGYRNGLAALEAYKQTQAAQMAVFMNDHVGALAADFHKRLDALEQQLAGRIAGVALELARQVVRSEIHQNPEVVVEVAEQALAALLTSAKQIVLRLHPDDFALSQGHLSEMLEARGARAVPDPSIVRGGCLIESDIAVVDATVEARWERAAAAMGHQAPWNNGHEPATPTPVMPIEDVDEDDEPIAGSDTPKGDAV